MKHIGQHIIALLDEITNSSKPADYIIAGYLHRNGYLTAAERGKLVTDLYQVLRRYSYFSKLTDLACSELNIDEKFKPSVLLYFYKLVSRDKLISLPMLSHNHANALEKFYRMHNKLEQLPASEQFAFNHSMPLWVVDTLKESFNEEQLSAILNGLNDLPTLTLRVNTLKTDRETLIAKLDAYKIEAIPGKLSPFAVIVPAHTEVFNLPAFHDGWFEVQDEGSQLISILLNAKPSARILDACAGSGGKTLHIGALMKGRGEIFAYDTDVRRFARINPRLQRSGLQNVRVLDSDEKMENFVQRYQGKLDGLLIDAPCTGSGTLRRNPDIKLHLTQALMAEMNEKQSYILDRYANYLKPGARLVYATCSILPQENEEIINKFLATHENFSVVPIKQLWSEIRVDFDISNLKAAFADSDYLQLYPHKHNCDAFFAAILVKNK